MLIQLQITNIALIENQCINFSAGLNVITGETGAGKSIILNSVRALMGNRISKDFVRTGEDRGSVEGIFEMNSRLVPLLDELGIESDDVAVLYREITSAGKSVCRINGRIVTGSVLRSAGEMLVDIHGQNDNQSLLKPSVHLSLLDNFGGEELHSLYEKYKSIWFQYCDAQKGLSELRGKASDIERQKDILVHQIDEISRANLNPGELQDLERKKNLLKNGEKIFHNLSEGYETLSGNGFNSVLEMLSDVMRKLHEIAAFADDYREISDAVNESYYILEDINLEIKRKLDDCEFSDALLEETEERLNIIGGLRKKYGESIEEIIAFGENAEKEYSLLAGITENMDDLITRRDDFLLHAEKLADELGGLRRKTADVIEKEVAKVLADLEMKGAVFGVITERYEELTATGRDKLEFYISANKGEPLKPLARTASGGEMARIMLAIKCILAKADKIPVMIFDEIDAGLSGISAQKTGEKLKELSESHQVICVTHHPQISVRAATQFCVRKTEKSGKMISTAAELSGEERIAETARLLSGADITQLSLDHAREMLHN